MCAVINERKRGGERAVEREGELKKVAASN